MRHLAYELFLEAKLCAWVLPIVGVVACSSTSSSPGSDGSPSEASIVVLATGGRSGPVGTGGTMMTDARVTGGTTGWTGGAGGGDAGGGLASQGGGGTTARLGGAGGLGPVLGGAAGATFAQGGAGGATSLSSGGARASGGATGGSLGGSGGSLGGSGGHDGGPLPDGPSPSDGGDVSISVDATDTPGVDAGPTCLIDGKRIAEGAARSDERLYCFTCQTAVSTTAWTALPEGAACATGQICHVDACVAGCMIAGVFVAADQAQGDDPCVICDPATSTTSWTRQPLCGGACPAPTMKWQWKSYEYSGGTTSLFFDYARGQMVATDYEGVGVWDGRSLRATGALPPACSEAGLVGSDPVRKRALWFGGADCLASTTPRNDTLEWDGKAWSKVVPSALIPLSRQRHSGGYDPIRQRMLMYGGADEDGVVLTDTWDWDGTTWSRVTRSTDPHPQAQAFLAFDEKRGLMTAFAQDRSNAWMYLWELKENVWVENTSGRIQPGNGSPDFLVYDSTFKRLVRGYSQIENLVTTETIEAWDENTGWQKLSAGGLVSNLVVTAGYDPVRKRLIVLDYSYLSELAWLPVPDHAPVLDAIADQLAFAGDALAMTFTATDEDQNPIKFTATGLPAGATLTEAGHLSWTPTTEQAGTYTLTVAASDGCLDDSQSFKITVLWPSYELPIKGPIAVTGPMAMTISFNSNDPSDRYYAGTNQLACGMTGVNPGKLQVYCNGAYSTGYSLSTAHPETFYATDFLLPLLGNLTFSSPGKDPPIRGSIEAQTDGTFRMLINAYTNPSKEGFLLKMTSTEARADLQ